MRNAILLISTVGLLLGAQSAFAQEATLEAEAFVDMRTEEEQRYDAFQEARDVAALESLASSVAGSELLAEEEAEEGALEEVMLFTPSAAMLAEAQELLRRDGVYVEASDVEATSTTFMVRDCYYVAFTAYAWGRWPPRYQLILMRVPGPTPEECPYASRTIDTSYATSYKVATRGSQGIVLSFESKQSPSGSALRHVRLFHISPKTLETVRSAFLGTWMGSTYVYGMHFEGNRLIVQTNRYTATYPRFLTSELPPLGVIFP